MNSLYKISFLTFLAILIGLFYILPTSIHAQQVVLTLNNQNKPFFPGQTWKTYSCEGGPWYITTNRREGLPDSSSSGKCTSNSTCRNIPNASSLDGYTGSDGIQCVATPQTIPQQEPNDYEFPPPTAKPTTIPNNCTGAGYVCVNYKQDSRSGCESDYTPSVTRSCGSQLKQCCFYSKPVGEDDSTPEPSEEPPAPTDEAPGPALPDTSGGGGNTNSCVSIDNADSAFTCKPTCIEGETEWNGSNSSCSTSGTKCCRNTAVYSKRGSTGETIPQPNPGNGLTPTPAAATKPVTNLVAYTTCVAGIKKVEIAFSPSSDAQKYDITFNTDYQTFDSTATKHTLPLDPKFPVSTSFDVQVIARKVGAQQASTKIVISSGAACTGDTGGSNESTCPNVPTTGGINTCTSVPSCTSMGGKQFNAGKGNAACNLSYGTTGNICCNTTTSPQAPSSPTIPAQPTPAGDGVANGAACNPSRGHLACLSSSDICKVSACGDGSAVCVRQVGSANVKVCPGTGVIGINEICPACPPAATATPGAPAQNPAPAGGGEGASCSSSSCQSGLSCSYQYYGGSGSYCCPSGTRFCPSSNTCTVPSACIKPGGNNSCSTATNHCYSGKDEECCGFPQKTCVKSGTSSSTWYCK